MGTMNKTSGSYRTPLPLLIYDFLSDGNSNVCSISYQFPDMHKTKQFICVFACVCVCVCMYVCLSVSVIICVSVCVCLCLYLSVCMYVYVCVCVCMYVCVCVHLCASHMTCMQCCETQPIYCEQRMNKVM